MFLKRAKLADLSKEMFFQEVFVLLCEQTKTK